MQYLTCEISPTGLSAGAGLTPASYTKQFTQPIIPKNASDYNVAVVSYDIPSATIPLLLPEIQPYPNTNPDKTPYSFTMTYNGVVGPQTYLFYISDNLNAPTPGNLSPSKPNRDPIYNYYYYVFSIQNWLNQINTCLTYAFNALQAEYGGGWPVGALPPYFTFNGEKLSFISQEQFYASSQLTPIYVYWNAPMSRFLQAFPSLNTSLSAGRDFQMNNVLNDNYYQPTGITPAYPSNWMKVDQEWDAFENWYSLKSLNISTSSLPIVTEFVNNASSNINGFGNVVSGQSILSTFIPIYTSGSPGSIRKRIQYSATTFRPISITNVEKIDSISLNVTWTDYQDNEYQLYIDPWERITIKILFYEKNQIISP